jgi:XRE family transcriptional regulator, regulator of sulfur utilization
MAARSTHFAGVLRRLREGAGLTLSALARKSGVTKQALSKLERGVNGPTWDTVQRLALALDVDCLAFADQAVTVPRPARGDD